MDFSLLVGLDHTTSLSNIIKSKNYAYIEVKGRPELSAFLQAAQRFIDDPDYSADVNRLCDFSQANLDHVTIE